MMIFCQNRRVVEKVGKRIYIVYSNGKYQIMNRHNDNEVTILGEYEKESNAQEVVREIFRQMRNKYDTYCMPEKL